MSRHIVIAFGAFALFITLSVSAAFLLKFSSRGSSAREDITISAPPYSEKGLVERAFDSNFGGILTGVGERCWYTAKVVHQNIPSLLTIQMYTQYSKDKRRITFEWEMSINNREGNFITTPLSKKHFDFDEENGGFLPTTRASWSSSDTATSSPYVFYVYYDKTEQAIVAYIFIYSLQFIKDPNMTSFDYALPQNHKLAQKQTKFIFPFAK